ncbi:MAG: ral stress protein CsbD [Nevskia sp.]|nr:ral stress protein CsbD [Nevskia sp.]
MNKQAQPPVAGGPGNITRNETAQHLGNVTARVPEAPVAGVISAKWKKHIGSARIVWSRFSEEELLNTGGQVDTLTGMVQERYALSVEEAGRRVRNFLQQYKL